MAAVVFAAWAGQETPELATIVLRDGGSITGRFVGADPTAAQIEVAGQKVTLGLWNVLRIEFGSQPAPVNQGREADIAVGPLEEALQSLERLAAGVDSGLTFSMYTQRLADARGVLDPALQRYESHPAAKAMTSAREALSDALAFWNENLAKERVVVATESRSGQIASGYGWGSVVQKKYSIPTERVDLPPGGPMWMIDRDDAVLAIWKVAVERVKEARRLLEEN